VTRAIVTKHLQTLKAFRDWHLSLSQKAAQQIILRYRLQTYLAKALQIDHRTLMREPLKKGQSGQLSQEKKKVVKQFFLSEDNLQLNAGKKEVKVIAGICHQKRYLCDSMTNLYLKFRVENPDGCGRTKFYLLKPLYLESPKANERCLCQRCTNLELIARALWLTSSISSIDKDVLLQGIVCSLDSYYCR
jgi:hypothetical protein